ncbi:hypothetical protein NBT14_01985 [Weissella paramesenteroides]|uniref:hypothetical protein n=2 Tax=Weissella paramesenteroides TaxID=1249 RepID=UPI0038575465
MDKKTLLSILTEAKQEMNDILEDETHLPSQYIAMGLKAGIMAVEFRTKRNQLEELPIDVVKRYNKAKRVVLQLHPIMDKTSVSDFDNGFQLASRALIDVITNDEQLGDKTKLNILERMNDQLTLLGKVD